MRLILAAALVLTGCATMGTGKPATLTGGTWLVEDIDGGGIIDKVRVEIGFDADGKVHGNAGCNRFNGSWTQAGHIVTLGPGLATTRMMCSPVLMSTEAKVLKVLARPLAVSFDATGAAFLKAADGGSLKIRRQS